MSAPEPPAAFAAPADGGAADIDARGVLTWLFAHVDPRRIVVSTSFGMEGACLLDIAADLFEQQLAWRDPSLRLRVVYIDTDFLFPETLALRDKLVARYPRLAFERISPAVTPQQQAAVYGPALWHRQPDVCCAIRKVEPLGRALAGAQAWVTALRRGQSATRADLPAVGHDPTHNLLKVCPLVSWTRPQVWDYCQQHGVPTNTLHEQGYPTVGCTHCTTRVPGTRPQDYTRLGRWNGTMKTECGLHGK